ncbi:MAG: EpsI family protein [Parvularculaceae bacterium]
MTPPRACSDWTLPVAIYGAYALAAIFLLGGTAAEMASTWFSSSSYHHGVAVAPLAVFMILARPRIPPATSPVFFPFAAAAAILWLMGHAAGVALVEQVAFVTLLIAGAGIVFGESAVRLWALPLLFLYFMVPFGEVLTPFLQDATARACVAMLNLVQVPASIDGVLIKTDAGVFEIAEACAGLNFLLAALMIACVYACQSLNTLGARLGFIAIAALTAVVANFLRAFLVILIATASDMKYAVGADHLAIGFFFYAFVFGILLWIGQHMQKGRDMGPERTPFIPRRPWRSAAALTAFAPLLTAAAYAALVIDRTPATTTPASLAPFSAPGWRVLPAPQNWAPPLNADARRITTYEKNGARVYVAASYVTHDRKGREIVTYENRSYDGDYWRKIASAREPLYLFRQSEETPVDILAAPENRRMLAVTMWWRGHEVYTDRLSFKLAQMRDKLSGVNPPGGMIVMASDYAGEPDEALSRLRAFTADVEPFGVWRARNAD